MGAAVEGPGCGWAVGVGLPGGFLLYHCRKVAAVAKGGAARVAVSER